MKFSVSLSRIMYACNIHVITPSMGHILDTYIYSFQYYRLSCHCNSLGYWQFGSKNWYDHKALERS